MTTSQVYADLLVVGGGVIGLSAARESAGRGLRVLVLEKAAPGRGSTWAAAGMLSPLGEARESGPSLDFGLESLRMYRSWVDTLEAESGVTFEYRECGKLRLALSRSESVSLKEKLSWAEERGLHVEWIGLDRLREEEPTLSHSVRSGLLIHDDFRLDNRQLVGALLEGCRQAGVQVQTGKAVHAVRVADNRVQGVTLSDGERINGDAVLVAAGAWSASLGGVPGELRVRPVRGQMLAIVPSTPVSTRVLESEDVYLVPRDDGRLLVGATVEDVGFAEANTADGTRRLLDSAIELVPALGSAPIVEMWSGLRPRTEDGDPIIGPDPETEGLYYATGHFRKGILLAPLTARIVGALVSGEEPPPLPSAFASGRFAETELSAEGA